MRQVKWSICCRVLLDVCQNKVYKVYLLRPNFFYNLTFTIRWLIQQCLSAQHMWLPVTPFVNPFVNPYKVYQKGLQSRSVTAH
jgi:hypothetical protein